MQPLFFAALAFAAGIALAGSQAGPLSWLAAMVAAAILAAALWLISLRLSPPIAPGRAGISAPSGRSTAAVDFRVAGGAWARRIFALLAIALAGAFWLTLRSPPSSSPSDSLTRWVAALRLGPRRHADFAGYLRDDPRVGRGYIRAVLQVEAARPAAGARQPASSGGRATNAWTPLSGGLRLYFAAPPAPPLRAGAALEVEVHPRPLQRYLDPGVADFNSRARRADVDFTASVAPGAYRRLPWLAGPASARLRAALWRRLSAGVDALVPPGRRPRANALLRGMLLGDTGRLGPLTRRDFQVDGVYHVVVVAGLHIGLLAFLLLWLLRLARCPPAWAEAATLAVLALYAWTISGRTPTLRVLLMLAVYFVARRWFRERQPLNAVGAAALLLLLWRPQAWFDPGFEMSFAAAALLAGVAAPHFARSAQPFRRATRRLADVGYDLSFPPRWAQFRLDLRALSRRWSRLSPWLGARALPALARGAVGLYEVAFVSFILQCGLAPFLAVYFHQVTPWAAAANIIALPLASLLLPLAWLALAWRALVGVHLAALTRALAWALAALAGGLLRWAHWAAQWPLAAARVPSPPAWALAVFALAVALWFRLARHGGRALMISVFAVAILAATLVWTPFPPRLPRRALMVTAIDVGQGDAIFVAFPNGRTLLVDAGPRGPDWDAGEEVVAPYLWSLGLRRLDAALLTHAHSDHMGGLPFILRNFRPRELWVTQTLPSEPQVGAMLRVALAVGARIRRREEGERFRIGRGASSAELDVLLPTPWYRAGPTATNQDSMVVRIAFRGASVLLEGDAEAPQERAMLASGLPLASTLLKVGHHGSRTSSLPPFLAAVRPAAAMISVGAGNEYGHPSPLVLQRLRAVGARVFRTDQGGAVEAIFGRGRMTVFRFVAP